jgi:hypothetical protein
VTLPDRDKVREALPPFENGKFVALDIEPEDVQVVIVAARAYADGRLVEVPVCQTCGGSGHDQTKFCPATAWVEDWQRGEGRKPKPNEVACHPCPDCVRGYPHEMRDLLAYALGQVLSAHLKEASIRENPMILHDGVVAVLDALTGRTE